MLVTAAREGVPAELVQVSGSAVPPLVVDRLVRRLYDTVGMDQALARWAVAGWAAALGKTVVSGHPVSPPAPLTPPVVTPLWPMHPIGIANASRVTQLTRWGTGSWQVAFSPDGRLLAVATSIGLYLYDIPALSEVRLIATDTALVSVAFAPDGRLLASGSRDGTVRLWDVQTGQLVRRLEGHTDLVWSVAFAPDGRLLASASDDKTVRLWDGETGRLVRTLAGHASSVFSVAFAPDGRWLASGSTDTTVRLWDVPTGRLVCTLEGHTSWVWSVAFAPDGYLLASGSMNRTIRL